MSNQNRLDNLLYKHLHTLDDIKEIQRVVKALIAQAEEAAFQRGHQDCIIAGDPTKHKYFQETIAPLIIQSNIDLLEGLLTFDGVVSKDIVLNTVAERATTELAKLKGEQ